MWSPSLKASVIVIPAPATSGLSSRHARRCSSDRKKFSVVQRESHARRSSARLPTQTMIPAASGPGPVGDTASASGAAQ
jgi:hypothetical protein